MTLCIVLVGDDGLPLPTPAPRTAEQIAKLDRAADLYGAFQWGQEAALGDTELATSQFGQTYGDDPEAYAEFLRGISDTTKKAVKH